MKVVNMKNDGTTSEQRGYATLQRINIE